MGRGIPTLPPVAMSLGTGKVRAADRARLLRQELVTVWLTGLSGAGKSITPLSWKNNLWPAENPAGLIVSAALPGYAAQRCVLRRLWRDSTPRTGCSGRWQSHTLCSSYLAKKDIGAPPGNQGSHHEHIECACRNTQQPAGNRPRGRPVRHAVFPCPRIG